MRRKVKKMGFSRRLYDPPKGSAESKAISELLRLKVHEIMTDDPAYYEETGTFADVWYAVTYETDMYRDYAVWGSQAEYDEYFGSSDGLNMQSYRSAVRWAKKYESLAKEATSA